MRNRFHFYKNETLIVTRSTEHGCDFVAMPQDILWIIANMLSRKDRASFALTAKRIARITRDGTFRHVKPLIEDLFSTSSIPFTSLDDVAICLGNLIDYTRIAYLPSLPTSRTPLQIQLHLANSIRLLLEFMCNVATYSTSRSLVIKLQRGYQAIESDDSAITVYAPDYKDLEQNDVTHAKKIAEQIRSRANTAMSADELQRTLHLNMAELSDMLHSISDGLTLLNIAPKTSILSYFMTLLSCGPNQPLTQTENTLIYLVIACTNALVEQLNTLNENVCAPIRKIEPQRINRR